MKQTEDIEVAIENGRKYNPDIIVPFTPTSIGIDPVWGSSAFGIVITQWVDDHIQIMHAENITDQIMTKCCLLYMD